jgi:hypothetical protein
VTPQSPRKESSTHPHISLDGLFPETVARVEAWAADPGVLGVLLVGSKSRGHEDARSDDDLEVLLTDAAFARLKPAECHAALIEGEGAARRVVYDAQLTSLTDIEKKRDSVVDLDHWPYERARIVFARDPRVAGAVKAAGRMDPGFQRARLAYATLDGWFAARRAIKTRERGFDAAVALLVDRGARALIRVLFALESRWTPLDHWLERELATLEDPQRAGDLLLAALRDRSPEAVLGAFERLEDRLAAEGVARPAGRIALFLELIHPSRIEERSRHALS